MHSIDGSSHQEADFELHDTIKKIAKSSYFDESFYAFQAEIDGPQEVLIRHYLEKGEQLGLQPSPVFDPIFYRSFYLNNHQNHDNALGAFINKGEIRLIYTHLKQLRSDAKALEGIDILPITAGFCGEEDLKNYKLNPIEFALLNSGGKPQQNEKFDEVFYLEMYPEVANYDRRPLRHYADIGAMQRRVRTQGELDFRKSVIAEEFDSKFYLSHFYDSDPPVDLLGHYVLHGARLGLDPTPIFNTEYYLTKYKDVQHTGLDPFQHYIQYGKAENRSGQSSAPWMSLPRKISSSSYFDESFYALQAKIDGSREVLVRHYLEQGEQRGLSPSSDFDPVFYRSFYLSNYQKHDNALGAFINQGESRLIYTSLKNLRSDAEAINGSGIFSTTIEFGGKRKFKGYELTACELALLNGSGKPHQNEKFDEVFYLMMYPDVATYDRRPMRHYADVGAAQLRVRTQGELDFRKSVVDMEFDSNFYSNHFYNSSPPTDLLGHYILHGARLGLDPTPTFNVEYYLTKYEDLRRGSLDPFQHYIQYGKLEGRNGNFNFEVCVKTGRKTFDEGKRTILVGLHEASRTGAPLLGLSIIEHLSKRYNVIAYLGRAGEIVENIASHVCKYAIAPYSDADLRSAIKHFKNVDKLHSIIYNSIEAGNLAKVAMEEGIACVGLIHEFSENTKPEGKMTRIAEVTDRIVVPCKLVEQSLQSEIVGFRSASLHNIVVRPQGKLPSLPRTMREQTDLKREEILRFLNIEHKNKTKIILGAGYVQIRKGVDLFIQTAAALRDVLPSDIRFLWVGDGYNPSRDFSYCIWLADMVKRLKLEDIVYFLPSQESLDVSFSLADSFYLPSRLDPFPNVCLDAVAANTPIVCFQDATGIAEHIADGTIQGTAVSFGDVSAAANAIKKQIEDERFKLIQRPIDGGIFDFDSYMLFVEDQLHLANKRRLVIDTFSERLMDSENFDYRFYCGSSPFLGIDAHQKAVRDFVSKSLNGIDVFNPIQGINAAALRQGENSSPIAALARLSTKSYASLQTHKCIDLSKMDQAVSINFKVALHIHLHYAEIALEIRKVLDIINLSADIFLTTTSLERSVCINKAFEGYNGGEVKIVVSPNQGRDVGPFILDFQETLRYGNYDLVGHFHGKKSVELGGTFGDKWRNFLFGTLLGNSQNVAAIQTLFARNEKLGLVFAEDYNCVGWCKNRIMANKLSDQIDSKLPLPEYPIFPIGNMFWCRPKALAPLWQLQLTLQDMPVEPIAYDGTILHALERMFPWFCDVAGFEWMTVFRSELTS